MQVIAYYDYFLLLPYILIFFLIARRFAKKHAETPREFYWLLINWWMKVIACILYAWMIVYYYGYGDPIGYKDRSDALFDSILNDFGNIKYLFLPANSFHDYLALRYSSMPYTSDLGFYNNPVFIISRISCITAFFTFNRFLIISFVFTNMAYYGFIIIYTTCKKIIKGYNKELAIACLFIPSCIYWSSGLAKEPVCMIALGIIFSCFLKLFIEKKIRLKTILPLILFSFILYTTKSYIFYCFLFAFTFWIFFNRIKKLILKSFLAKIGFWIFAVMAIAGITYFGGLISRIFSDNIGDIISANFDMYESMATRARGSFIEIKDLDVSSLGGILKFIPEGMVNVFFRPFPWEIANVLMVFTVLENLFFIFLFFKVLLQSRFFTKHLFINKNYEVFAILFTLTLGFSIAISTFNFGSMVRYKMPFLPFWAGFLLIMNKKLTNHKRTVNG